MGYNYDNELIEKLIKLLRGVNRILDDEPSELKIEKKDIDINGDTLTIHKQNLHINNEKTVSTNKTIIFNDIYSLVKELKRVKITVMENDNFEHEFVITGRHILFDELHFQLLNAFKTDGVTNSDKCKKIVNSFFNNNECVK